MLISAYNNFKEEMFNSRRGIAKNVIDGYKRFTIPDGYFDQTSDEAVHILKEIKRKTCL